MKKKIGKVSRPLPNLTAARFNAGLTQKDLALKAGVDAATVSNAEKGKPINPRTAKKLADALDVTIAALVSRNEEALLRC